MLLGDSKKSIFQSSVIASLSRHKRKALQWSTEILGSTFWQDDLHNLTKYFSTQRLQVWAVKIIRRHKGLCPSKAMWQSEFLAHQTNKTGHSEQWWKPSTHSASCSRSKQQDNLTFWFGNTHKTCPEDSAVVRIGVVIFGQHLGKADRKQGQSIAAFGQITLRQALLSLIRDN